MITSFVKEINYKMRIIFKKLEVHDTYKKDGKITTNIESGTNEDVKNKAYLD